MAEKKPRLCFYFCGFNIALIAGLFTYLFGRVFRRHKGAMFAAVGNLMSNLLGGVKAGVVRVAANLWTQIGSLFIPTTLMLREQPLDLGQAARLSAVTVGDKGAVLLLE